MMIVRALALSQMIIQRNNQKIRKMMNKMKRRKMSTLARTRLKRQKGIKLLKT